MLSDFEFPSRSKKKEKKEEKRRKRKKGKEHFRNFDSDGKTSYDVSDLYDVFCAMLSQDLFQSIRARKT